MMATSSSMFETLQRLRHDGLIEQKKEIGRARNTEVALSDEQPAPAFSSGLNTDGQQNATQEIAAVSPIDIARNENTSKDAFEAMLDDVEENSAMDDVQEVQAESVSEPETMTPIYEEQPGNPAPFAQHGNVHPDRLQNIHPDRLQNIRTGTESAGGLASSVPAEAGKMQTAAAGEPGSSRSSAVQKQASASLATTFRQAAEGEATDDDGGEEWQKFEDEKLLSGEQQLPPGLEKEIVRLLCKQTLYVRNLPKMIKDEECVELFAKYGTLMDLRLGEKKSTAGSAYVVYQTAEEAREALRELTGLRVKDKYLVAQLHRPERAKFVQDEKKAELKRIEREIFNTPRSQSNSQQHQDGLGTQTPAKPRAAPPPRDGNRTPFVSNGRTPLVHPGQRTPLFPGGTPLFPGGQTPLVPGAPGTKGVHE